MFKKAAIFLSLTLAITCFADNNGDGNPPVIFKKKKPEVIKTNLQLGLGMMGSVLYLSRNIKEKNDAKGYVIVANYGGHKLWRFNVQYTKYLPINIEPTWYNIKAYTVETNFELMARFPNNKSFLYPFFGASFNSFKGYFTGQNDFLNLSNQYGINTNVINQWFGLNVGTGFEHNFGPIVIFADYRMRLGRMEKYNGFNIMDICYSAGLRYRISVPTLKKIYRGVGDKYHWF